ncbi:hypothetical protein LCGC14_1014220 [marine sediment metagenome]|uniref:CBM-cenC domain-containing protein n=1 Tax=marine sediment metagenome TaxID=412755 RepID=A0A0F9NKW4_9ZZZZ
MGSEYTKRKHGIGVTSSSLSRVVGMVLAQKNGVPLYTVYDDEYLAQQSFTGVPGYGNLPSEKEIAMRQDDWRSGFGLHVYDSSDTKRYFASYNMDLRFKGMGILGGVATAVTFPTTDAPAIVDAGMELWDDVNTLTNWTKDEGTVTRDSNFKHEGNYSADLQDVGSNTEIHQDLATTQIQGRKFTFTCWVRSKNINDAFIRINDGVGTTDSSYHSGNETWEQLIVTRTFAQNASRLRLICHCDANNQENYFDEVAITRPSLGNPAVFAEFNNKLYMGMGKLLTKLNSAGNEFEGVYEFDADITDLAAFTDDKLYIALGTSTPYWEMTTGEALTENTLTVKQFDKFVVVHAAAPVMWGKDSTNTIRSTINPANGGTQWSAVTTVGSSAYAINSLVSDGASLFMIKGDRPFYLDSDGAVQVLTNRTRPIASSTGGTNSFFWDDALYMPFGTASLLENSEDGDLEWIDPALFSTNLGDFDGKIQAIAGDEQWLFAVVDNSSKIEVLAGRRETISGLTSWVWHPLTELTLAGCQAAFVSSIYQKRLWLASTSSGDSLYYIPLYANYGDVTNDINRSFQTNGYFITPRLHANFKGDVKAFTKITVELGHAYDADIYFECWHRRQGASTWVDAGDLKGSATDRRATLYFSNVSAEWIQLKFVGKTDDTTKTPILMDYDVRGILYPPQRNMIYCEVKIAEGQALGDGVLSKVDKDMITALDDARAATWPVLIKDIDGSSKYVKFLPINGQPRWYVFKDEKGRAIERRYKLLMQEVTLA